MVQHPYLGPTWLNPVKVLLTLSVLGLIVLSMDDLRNTDYLWAIIGIMPARYCPRASHRWRRHARGCLVAQPLSGIAAAFSGFIISNPVLIVAGSLVGASGLILTFIMYKAMNRTLPDVLFKSFGGTPKNR